MADTIRPIDYFSLQISDRPGEGAKLLVELKRSGVNMLAFNGFPIAGGKAQIALVPEDAEALRQAVARQGLELSDRKRAFLVQGEDRVGAVSSVLEKLASQEIDVVASQGVSAGGGRWGMILWVKPGDYQRAKQAFGA